VLQSSQSSLSYVHPRWRGRSGRGERRGMEASPIGSKWNTRPASRLILSASEGVAGGARIPATTHLRSRRFPEEASSRDGSELPRRLLFENCSPAILHACARVKLKAFRKNGSGLERDRCSRSSQRCKREAVAHGLTRDACASLDRLASQDEPQLARNQHSPIK